MLTSEIKTKRTCIKQLGYTGTNNITVTGKACMSWNKHNFQNVLNYDVDLAENFCRDPFNYGFDWCYINSNSWEPCLIEGKVCHGIL